MINQTGRPSIFSLRFVSQAGSVTAIVVGFLVLVGWMLDIAALKSVIPGLATMKANTALAFILAGVSLWILQGEHASHHTRRIGQASAAIVALAGLLTLSEYLLGWNWGLDQLLFNDPSGTVGIYHPGRMSPATALNFALVGCGLLLHETRRGMMFACYLVLGATVISLVALVGYTYGVESLHAINAYSTMALHTTLTFLVLCGGILAAHQGQGLMGVVTGKNIGSALGRRLLPLAILVPLVLGWLLVKGQEAGLYGMGFGTAIFAVLLVIIFVTVIGWTARSLSQFDEERTRAEGALERLAKTLEQRVAERTRELEASREAALNMMEDAEEAREKAEQGASAQAQLAAIVVSSDDAIISADGSGIIMSWNKGAQRLFGYEEAEVLAKPLPLLMPERYRDAHHKGMERMLSTGESRVIGKSVELHGLRKDGSEFPLELSLSTWSMGQRTFFSGIIRDITERKRAEEEVRHLNAQLITVNKELEAFSYSVSHDLRAPLRHINGFTELLKAHEGSRLDATGQRYMNTIVNSAKRMGTLIDDLLVFSLMGKSRMRTGTVNLDTLVRDVMNDLHTEVNGREVSWHVDNLPEVYGDATMLRQVWVNLMGNAVKYTRTRARTEIEIGSRQEGEEHVFFVRDNGVGFDPQYGDKLFGVFQRLHHSDEFEGTGVGLANVRRIVQRHGGRTWAEGRVDSGAVFYFSLPDRKEQPE